MSWFSVLAVAVAVLMPVQVNAQQLPHMQDDPWLGYFSGYKRRNFEFGVDNEGKCELYLIGAKTKQRVGHTRIIKIYTEVLVQNAAGKIYAKRLKEDEGFATEMKPGLDHEEVKFTAETTGDAKVEISVKYDRDRIIMDGRVLDQGTLKGEKIYLSFKVMVPAMYGTSYNNADEKKLKSAMRKDRIKFVRAKDQKRVSLKSYEEAVLNDEDVAQGGVTELTVAMDAQEGNDFVFTTLDGKGVLAFENSTRSKKGPLWKGYMVKWKREYTKETKKGISPFVIELK